MADPSPHQKAALAYLDSLGTVGAQMRRKALESRMAPPKQPAAPVAPTDSEPLPELGELFATE